MEERLTRIELVSQPWQGRVIAIIPKSLIYWVASRLPTALFFRLPNIKEERVCLTTNHFESTEVHQLTPLTM